MTSRDPIGTYMRTLASRLGQLDKADAGEVMREIEGHIRDVVEQAQARGKTTDIHALLQGFGPPEALAAPYVAHIRTGAPPPAGFGVIQRVRQTVTRGLYYSGGASGFGVALGLLLLALAKLVQPSQVGVWSTAGGNSIAIAWSGSPYLQAEELLGYWLVPMALLASVWCAELTRRVLRALRRGLA